MAHPLGSPYVRDQLSLRTFRLNEKRTQPDGEFVLYWMQSTQRLEENWALRLATVEADRIGRPLLVVQTLGADDAHTARTLRFALEGAAEVERRAARLGITYRAYVARRRGDAVTAIRQLARRANVIVTDAFPVAGVAERTRTVADVVDCRLLAVDSAGVVPVASFPREEYAARTIRPKLLKVLDLCLEPVEDRAPRRTLDDATPASAADSARIAWTSPGGADLDALVSSCDVDHAVAPVARPGGYAAARGRLDAFVADGLDGYGERRRDPSDDAGSSRLSPWLHAGQIAPAEVVRAVRERSGESVAEFIDEMVVWRELALNFCTYCPGYARIDSLPAWVQRSMDEHARDPRPHRYSLEVLEAAATESPLWNAAQRELMETGSIHNVVRMLWGKSMLTWTARYADAFAHLVYLNDRWGLDGRDPNGYAGIQWCFGRFDRPFAARPVWGMIRPMSLERAMKKRGVAAYVARWSGESAQRLELVPSRTGV